MFLRSVLYILKLTNIVCTLLMGGGLHAQHIQISRYQALLLTPSHCACQYSSMIRSS